MIWQGHQPSEALIATILFIPLSAAQYNLEADWAEATVAAELDQFPSPEK